MHEPGPKSRLILVQKKEANMALRKRPAKKVLRKREVGQFGSGTRTDVPPDDGPIEVGVASPCDEFGNPFVWYKGTDMVPLGTLPDNARFEIPPSPTWSHETTRGITRMARVGSVRLDDYPRIKVLSPGMLVIPKTKPLKKRAVQSKNLAKRDITQRKPLRKRLRKRM